MLHTMSIVTLFGTHISLPYAAMCGVYCKKSSDALITLLQTFVESRGDSSIIEMTYPNAQILDEKFYLGYSLAALTFDDSSPPHVLESRLIILHHMVDLTLPGGKDLARDFEMKLRNHFANITETSAVLRFQLMNKELEIEEQRTLTITMFPYFGATVIILSLFMLFTLVDFPLYRSQHIESFFGVLSPGMAVWTAVGFLWWAGYEFSNILAIVPFLTVTIGIDDAFLILAGWRHSTKGASLEQRMGESVAASRASVTVTAVTDVLCFAIGLFSNMPVVRLFCIYTTVALFILFLYQMTFFCGIVCVLGKRQIAIEKSRESENTAPKTYAVEGGEIELKSDDANAEETHQNGKLEFFVEWIHSKMARAIIVLLFLIHIGMTHASYFATKINTAFDMENLYMKSSPLTEISKRMQDHSLGEEMLHRLDHRIFASSLRKDSHRICSNFLQTALSAIILMSVLVLLFVMDLEAIVSVVLSIVSICLGTVSYLHVWGVHLDAVSLIDILMSIGFSVDYSAHICYHYFAHAGEEVAEHEKEADRFSGSPRARRSKLNILYTLQGVGYPVVQAGLSTIMGVLPLIFLRAYVVAVFWKTVILVGILGMAHALLLLPVIFVLTDDVKAFVNSRRKLTVAPLLSSTVLKELPVAPQEKCYE